VASDSNLFRARSVCPHVTLPGAGVMVLSGGEVSISDKGHEGAGDFASDLVVLDASTGMSPLFRWKSTPNPNPNPSP
jgi:hypothetical protein